MGNKNKLIILLLSLTICFFHCNLKTNSDKNETYDKYRTQRLEDRDSMLIIYTVKEWHNNNWHIFEDVSLMYESDNSQISYFIGGAFYSPDRLKLIVWIGEKKYNSKTREVYNEKDTSLNRICPVGGDTVYSMKVIVGFRDDTNKIWHLYPLLNKLAACYNTKERIINVMDRYFFKEMKHHSMHVVNDDKHYGGKVIKGIEFNDYLQEYDKFYLKEYGYNLQDEDFWDKSLIWQKGANIPGLFNFQTKGNVTPLEKDVEFVPPEISYPQEILKNYN